MMWWARVLIFGIPLAALSVGSWAAWQVRSTRQPRADEVVVMLPGALPTLNPFRPVDETERQMLDLLHEPLVRLGRNGRLSPALAEHWEWHRHVTCWFSSPDIAQQAALRLQALSGNQWVASQLEAATAEGNAVTMRFIKPDGQGPDEAMRSIADLQPLLLTLVQLPADASRQALLKTFVQERADLVKRLWFDGQGTCEMVATIPGLQVQQSLTQWLQARQQPAVPVRSVGEVTGLIEPILDFKLRPQARWHDGSAVAVEDVRATVGWVNQHPGSMAAGDGFRQVQSITAAGTNLVRIAYRSRYGPALADWVDFPILPAAWLRTHGDSWAEPPPGAGEYRLSAHDAQSVTLESTGAAGNGTAIKRVRFVVAAPNLKTRVGLATKSLDALWPSPLTEVDLRMDRALDFQATPPRNRLFVLWNLRSSVLADPRVREALGLATNRPALVNELLGGRGRIVDGIYPPGVWFNQQLSLRTQDLAAAERKLAEAGWLKDVSGVAKTAQRMLDFELLITAGNPWRQRLAQALARQWARVGARVTVSEVDAQELVSRRLEPGRFDAVLLGMDFETTWDQSSFWHSSRVKGSLNFSGVADPQLDLLLDALAGEYDLAQVAVRAKEVEDRVLSLHAIMPLFSDLQQIAIRRDRFPDLQARPTGLMLRDLLRPASTRVRTPLELKMIIPDE
ncbi:MAG: ABC transporter substrate-binding protein [Prosthecobacter sp.]|nr:ABC transporter substrate-binding protein [Prosthecobacter sp.]